MRYIIPLLLLCNTSFFGKAQLTIAAKTWNTLQYNILTGDHLQKTWRQTDSIKALAIKAGDEAVTAHCLWLQLLIKDRRNEDTFYLKNAAFIDSTLRQTPNKNGKLAMAMHLIKAERLYNYLGLHFYSYRRKLMQNPPGGTHYQALTREELLQQINGHYENALRIARQMPDEDAGDMLWLSAQPFQFLFKPALPDIVFANWLDNNKAPGGSREIHRWPAYWHHLPPGGIISLADTAIHQLGETQQPRMHLWLRWMKHHQNNPEAAYYIEGLARKSYQYPYWENKEEEAAFEKYLSSSLQSPYTAVKAYAVYELCDVWHRRADNYNNKSSRYNYNNTSFFDTAARMYFVKWRQLFAAHEKMLDSFAVLKNSLIEKKLLTETVVHKPRMQQYQPPGREIPVLIYYRNTPQMVVRVIRLNQAAEIPGDDSTATAWLLTRPAVSEKIIRPPLYDDYQNHNMFITLDALPAGRYILQLSDSFPVPENKKAVHVEFAVTRNVVLVHDNQAFLLDRMSGAPLRNSMAIKGAEKTLRRNGEDSSYTAYSAPIRVAGNLPAVKISNATTSIRIINGADTSSHPVDERDEENFPAELYNKEDHDNLAAYFNDQTRIYMYTDRSIYRPGQTVHYKGIFIGRHPYTGQPMMMNRENLEKQFPQAYKKWVTEKTTLYIKDAFAEEKDTLLVRPNGYGSFSGTFKLPKNAATGDWEFYGEDATTAGSNFRVEEYKRPSYELVLEKPATPVTLGDTFQLQLKTRTFSGVALGRVFIKYRVVSVRRLKASENSYETRRDTLMDAQDYTGPDGLFKITVADSIFARNAEADSIYQSVDYTITAEALDANGESHEESLDYYLSNQPVNISMESPGTVEKHQIINIPIAASMDPTGPVSKKITVKIYKAGISFNPASDWPEADVWLLDKAAFSQKYPELSAYGPAVVEERGEVVFTTEIKTGPLSRISLPTGLLEAGIYSIEAICRENGRITGQTTGALYIYDLKTGATPEAGKPFHHLSKNEMRPGDTVTMRTGHVPEGVYSIFQTQYYVKEGTKLVKKTAYEAQPAKPGIGEWRFVAPGNLAGNIQITHIYILNNEVYSEDETVYLKQPEAAERELVVEKYRKRLAPGSKETFTVSLKTKNKKLAAELMTTMYDASLDKLQPHNWATYISDPDLELGSNWQTSINSTINQYAFNYSESWLLLPGHQSAVQPLWWLNPLDYAYNSSSRSFDFDNHLSLSYSGQLFGLKSSVGFDAGRSNTYLHNFGAASFAFTSSSFHQLSFSTTFANQKSVAGGLFSGEADVMGDWYNVPIRGGSWKDLGFSKNSNGISVVTSAVPFLRIAPNAKALNMGIYQDYLVVLDGEIYKGDLGKLDPAAITDMVTLNGADAVELFGPGAAKGLLLLSTKGMIPLPEPPAPAPVIRKNFNETAFFFPAVYADTAGYYHIEFTLPESVTEWKWKMMAHDKQAHFTLLEKTIVSQLPLMVQPTMPRVLYQGDRIVLKSRISNLDSSSMTGKLQVAVEDAVTGENLTDKVCSRTSEPFSIQAMDNLVKGLTLIVPDGLLNPLKIKVSVQTNGFADAEEHIIPILTKKILVTAPVPYRLEGNKKIQINTPASAGGAMPYGIGLFIQPQPQAALLHALPALAAYPYSCAEQTFNKMLANIMAVYAMRNDAELRRQYPAQSQQTAEPLPGQPSEELMPWLQLNNAHAQNQQRLAALLDTLATHKKIEAYFEDLKKLQLPDGAMRWFPGGRADDYISHYLLAAMGRLEEAGIHLSSFNKIEHIYKETSEKLAAWCDLYLNRNGIYETVSGDKLFAWYARSFWVQQWPLSKPLRDTVLAQFTRTWQLKRTISSADMPLLIAATLRLKNLLPQLQDAARQAMQSIKETAVNDEQGVRWKEISDAAITSQSGEEKLALLAEMFLLAGNENAMAKGILQWVLQNRASHEWGSTKATAAMLQLLYRFRQDKPQPATVTAMAGPAKLKVNNGLINGVPEDFKNMATWPADATVSSNGNKAAGSLLYYYFTNFDKLEAGPVNGLRIEKTMQVYNDSTRNWQPVLPATVLHNGQKIRVQLSITTPQNLRYVMIEDKRAACLEPQDIASGYHYESNMGYYQSIRDAGYCFFAETITAGTHTIQYETVVAQEGQFTNGPAMLQCMYNPGVRAYSGSVGVRVE